MKKRMLRLFGLILSVIGILIILVNSAMSVTGAVILDSFAGQSVSILGLVCIIMGIILLSFSESSSYETRESKLRQILGDKRYESLSEKDKIAVNKAYRRHEELEDRRENYAQSQLERSSNVHVIRTEHFERAIRNHDPDIIQKAIDKIGTGKGKEEKLSNGAGYSVRVTKGGRIIFDKIGGKIELLDYLPKHEYKKR